MALKAHLQMLDELLRLSRVRDKWSVSFGNTGVATTASFERTPESLRTPVISFYGIQEILSSGPFSRDLIFKKNLILEPLIAGVNFRMECP